MDHFNRLPEEIVHLIFSEIDNKQLLELETVCKHWKTVLRSRVQYWKKEIELDCQSIDDLKVLERFVFKMLSRSKGEMQSWRVKIASSALKHYQEMFKRIPTSEPHSLDIEILDLDHYGYDHHNHRLFDREFNIMMNTIKQCSSLKSLRVTADPDLSASFGSDLKDHPIAKCKLETLQVYNMFLGSAFKDDSILEMVSQAKHIDLSDRSTGEDTDIVRLIISAQDTLEVCTVRFSGISRIGDTFRLITLPRLKRLHVLNNHGISSLTGQNRSDPIQCSLICPNLRHLTLSGDITSSQCETLLTASIETLYLELNEYFCESLRNNLRNCLNLSTLRIAVHYPYQGDFPSQFLEEVLDELILLPIKEFVLSFMVHPWLEFEQIILNFFRKWSNNSRKMNLFLLYQDVHLPEEILEELSQYCQVTKAFARNQEDSTYSEEELRLRSYGYLVGR